MKTRERIISKIEQMSKHMRQQGLRIALSAGNNGAHLGSGLSIIELTATLYGGVMTLDLKNPQWKERDRFILSKGHGTLGYYTALAEVGFLTEDELSTFEENEGFLPGQPSMNMSKGIEFSGGSLGLGLSLGIGVALVAKSNKKQYNTYVLMGDGECNEGTVWEAAMAASHYKLDNLIAIVDLNSIQSDGICSDIMDMGDIAGKWQSFGWETIEIEGHNVREIYDAFTAVRTSGKPYVVLAHTVKGKGISFMEHNNEWHHNRLTQAQFDTAMLELQAQL